MLLPTVGNARVVVNEGRMTSWGVRFLAIDKSDVDSGRERYFISRACAVTIHSIFCRNKSMLFYSSI